MCFKREEQEKGTSRIVKYGDNRISLWNLQGERPGSQTWLGRKRKLRVFGKMQGVEESESVSCSVVSDWLRTHEPSPLSMGFPRQEYWSGLPFPSPMHESEKWKWSHSVLSDSSRPHGLQPTRLLHPWDFPGKSTGVGCHCLFHQGSYRILKLRENSLKDKETIKPFLPVAKWKFS